MGDRMAEIARQAFELPDDDSRVAVAQGLAARFQALDNDVLLRQACVRPPS